MAKNDDNNGAADECPPGVDPDDYTCGLHNLSFVGMLLVTLLFVPLAVVLLCHLPATPAAPASAPALALAPSAEETFTLLGTTLRQSVHVVWTVSLLASSYLSIWTYTLSRTMGAAAIFLRVSYAAALAYAAGGLFGPVTGMSFAHLTTAWAAGLLGYALAEYRMDAGGGERAAEEAAARTPASRSEGQEAVLYHSVFMIVLTTLFLGSGVVWLVFFPSDDVGGVFLVSVLSVVIWWILHMWAALMNFFWLHEALVSNDSMVVLVYYFLASLVASIIILFVLLGNWFWAYFFGLEMMAMAAFFGYILAVNTRRKEILARDQPLTKDLELGDVIQESAQA